MNMLPKGGMLKCMVSLRLSIYKSLEINIWNVRHTFKSGWGNQRKEYIY